MGLTWRGIGIGIGMVCDCHIPYHPIAFPSHCGILGGFGGGELNQDTVTNYHIYQYA